MTRNTNNDKVQEQITPLQKSTTAFLIKPCDLINSLHDKPYYTEEWDFSTSTSYSTHKANASKVSFRSIPAEFVQSVQDTLYHLYHYKKQAESLSPSSRWIDVKKIGLARIAACLNSTDWSTLEDRNVLKSFLRTLKNCRFSYHQLTTVISTLSILTASGIIIAHIDGDKIYQQASTPKKTQQHIALPPKMLQTILNHALSVIAAYHEYRHIISQVMEAAYDIKRRGEAGERLNFDRHSRKGKTLSMNRSAIEARVTKAVKNIDHEIPDFRPDIKGLKLGEIMTSCIIVVLAFSGARIGEVLSFNKSNYKKITINGKEIIVLQGETSKSHNGKPKTTTWQSHPIALKALELAYDMMQSTRKCYEQKIKDMEEEGNISKESIEHMRKQLNSSFITPSLFEQKSNNFTYINTINESIKRYLPGLGYKHTQEDIDTFDLLNPSREGQLALGRPFERITSHTFRRTFAVFFVRYGFGSAQGIKFQYKHQNLNMSDYYANNAVLGKMNDLMLDTDLLDELKEAGIELGIELYDDIFNRSENLSGKQGEAIQKDRFKQLEEGESVLMTLDEIEAHLRSGDFTIVQLPSGAYCTNATCDRLCGTMPFRAEKTECEHKVVTDKGAKEVAKQRLRLIKKFRALNSGDQLKSSILAGLKIKIQIGESTLQVHNINYTAFTEEIIALQSVT
ncbi:site-specific integrase [Vibrio splendidus]|uniref:site-specific integrase n=1 Tax=unclassified Vibrio TaxID=2614977 RepID=UPI0010BE13DD|nr:site-specific integrase [Vibrio sp. F13]TKG05343.1 site-specific integrase [Vibrio sp. F13]